MILLNSVIYPIRDLSHEIVNNCPKLTQTSVAASELLQSSCLMCGRCSKYNIIFVTSEGFSPKSKFVVPATQAILGTQHCTLLPEECKDSEKDIERRFQSESPLFESKVDDNYVHKHIRVLALKQEQFDMIDNTEWLHNFQTSHEVSNIEIGGIFGQERNLLFCRQIWF